MDRTTGQARANGNKTVSNSVGKQCRAANEETRYWGQQTDWGAGGLTLLLCLMDTNSADGKAYDIVCRYQGRKYCRVMSEMLKQINKDPAFSSLAAHLS